MMDQQLQQYTALTGSRDGVRCDRCLQPIDTEHFQRNVHRMQQDFQAVDTNFKQAETIVNDLEVRKKAD